MVPGSGLMATGLSILLLAVSAGVGPTKFGLLLGFAGVIVGANLIAVGVRRVGEEPPRAIPTCPAAVARLGAFTELLRRNLAVVGLIMASSAVTTVAGAEAGLVLCGGMVALFLLGICLINIRVLGE